MGSAACLLNNFGYSKQSCKNYIFHQLCQILGCLCAKEGRKEGLVKGTLRDLLCCILPLRLELNANLLVSLKRKMELCNYLRSHALHRCVLHIYVCVSHTYMCATYARVPQCVNYIRREILIKKCRLSTQQQEVYVQRQLQAGSVNNNRSQQKKFD